MTTTVQMADLLEMCVDENASDLHLRVGIAPSFRIHGEIKALDTPPLTPADTEAMAQAITSEDNLERLRREGGVDFGLAFKDRARFRVSVFKERGNIGLVLRLIPNKLLTLEQIGLPHSIKDLLFRPRGLILVTGPTGSGKTTTLASMVDFINSELRGHILTIEDPLEYFHHHKRCIVTQREVNVDVPTFAEALRRGLRQDPDVILVGEMRDLETMAAAITAAETGHLVFATLHTTGAAATVNRMVDAFPANQQEQIRTQLATTLQAVISQLLLLRTDGKGRVAAFEIMIATPAIRALIRKNETYQITSEMQTGARYGMIPLDTSLMSLYQSGIISYSDLITVAQDPDGVMKKLKSLTGNKR